MKTTVRSSVKGIRLHKESSVTGESWHEERDRIIQLLKAIESGAVIHVDKENRRHFEAVNPRNLALLKPRRANLVNEKT